MINKYPSITGKIERFNIQLIRSQVFNLEEYFIKYCNNTNNIKGDYFIFCTHKSNPAKLLNFEKDKCVNEDKLLFNSKFI